jgi:hypothetical protein
MSSSLIEVGRFSFDTRTQVLTGPREYLESKGGAEAAVKDALSSATFRYGASEQPNPFILMLVAMQTDFAAYEGARTLGRDGRS